jgi:hypothetical protein
MTVTAALGFLFFFAAVAAAFFRTLPRLFEALALARGDGRYARLLKTLSRVDLLILDDWGLAPLTGEQRRDLLEVVDDRHQRGSTIITSQVPIENWHDVIADPTIADAVLDRLVHNAHRLALNGDSAPNLTQPRKSDPTPNAGNETRPPSSEQVAAFDRTAWSRSIGIHGRNPRNPHPVLRNGQ